jgi:1,4-alpha-glucan branching enzyme
LLHHASSATIQPMAQTSAKPVIVDLDPWLTPYTGAIEHRTWLAGTRGHQLTQGRGTLADFASGHEYFGLHQTPEGWVLRERAPNATRIALVGDFNEWKLDSQYEFVRRDHGTWELVLPRHALQHEQHYKMVVFWNEGGREVSGERIPSFCRRVTQDENTKLFSAQVWAPQRPYEWRNPNYRVSKRAPLIYEAHVGMAQERAGLGTYREFTQNILPRIHKAGYNTIQLMAVQEHPYYGSFGYQVSNFFAPSSRFGTPEELKELIDTAHSLDIAVVMDLVHSHAVKNELEGLSKLDGSYTLYFHDGARGEHPAWNTRLFDYGKIETLHFLLSNCRYWLDAFKFDGFRFDGVTSMIYRDHGLGSSVGSYDHYFCGNVDEDAMAYLALANQVIHEVRPDAITVAEEVSGMPGLAAPFDQGGTGFNYRLAMGVPDYWIKLLKHVPDEQWSVAEMWRELSSRRVDERTIGYAESHDQALVGDKTVIFWLADQEMYWKMRVTDESLVIDRAIALHKMIRLITLGTAGNGYLNFIGNEFGHPEWVDFPREGNNWSYHYARRQWSLRDAENLRYKHLADFDQAMMELASSSRLLEAEWPYKHYEHVQDGVLAFERAGLLFVFNFHPTHSWSDRRIGVPPGSYRIVLSSDASPFGGFNRVDTSLNYATSAESSELSLYLPARTALVLAREGIN